MRAQRSIAGNAATEFALIMPILLLFIGGIVELGRVFQVYGAVNRLALRYATTYADCYDYPPGACGTELATYAAPAAIANMAPQLPNTITLRMFEVQMSGATPPAATVVYAYPTGATLSSAELTQAQTMIGSNQTGVVVTVSYPHTLIFFAALMKKFLYANPAADTFRTISYTVAQRKT